MDTTTNFLFFNSRDELLRLDISKIVYFESDGNYTNIILTNKLRGIICLNLAQTEKVLEERELKNKKLVVVSIVTYLLFVFNVSSSV